MLVPALPLGTVAYDPEPKREGRAPDLAQGRWVNKLDAMRQPRRELQRRDPNGSSNWEARHESFVNHNGVWSRATGEVQGCPL